MATDAQDLSGISGADAGAPGDGVELEELAHAITENPDAQGGAEPSADAAAPAPEPSATVAPPGPAGPVPPPPSELVHTSPSRMVGDTPTVVATPTSEAVRHAMGHHRANTPAGPRTIARPIFRHPRAGTTHTTGETPAAGDSSAMETRMNTEQPASHVSLRQLAREARAQVMRRTQPPVSRAKAPERSSSPSPGANLRSLLRRDR